MATPSLVLPLTFGILLAAALYYRNRPEVHKRLMLFAVLGNLTSVPTGHLMAYWNLFAWAPLLFPGSLVAFLSLVPLYDRFVIGRIHPVSLWVPIGIFLSQQAVFVVIAQTAAWRDFSGWLIR